MAQEKDNRNSAERFVKRFEIIGGELVPRQNAAPDPFDRGFLYGEGLFETILVRRGRLVLLDEHIGRMSESAIFFKLSPPPDSHAVAEIIKEQACAFSDGGAVLRLILSHRGGGYREGSDGVCDFTIQMLSHTPASPDVYDRGAVLVTSKTRRSTDSQLFRHKTLSYLESILARREAESGGAYEALFLNTDDLIAECSMSNIFFVDGEKLLTPSLECNILPGITRARILSLAQEAGIPTREHSFAFIDVLDVSEVFVTSSLSGIVPVREIDGKVFGKVCPGPVTRRLTSLYMERVLDGP